MNRCDVRTEGATWFAERRSRRRTAMANATRPPQPLPSGAFALPAMEPMSTAFAAVARPSSTPAVENARRLTAVVYRLVLHMRDGVRPQVFIWLCINLARGIDYALTLNDIPPIARYLPSIVKKIYEHKDDTQLQSAITAVIISAKNACRNGWFGISCANELLSMADELCSSYCMAVSVATEATVLDTLLEVIGRYYPWLKLFHVIVSFEAKTGYDVLMADFQIQRNISREKTVGLFVVQTDNLETSSCIITPPQVSFLVNGKGVDRRSNVSLDGGPQFPTNISKMLKFGTNIIQAVGYFSGNYIIAVAFMEKTTPALPILEEYIQPVISNIYSDSEIVEGPSRISLNCPISFSRMKTPVKGHLCKHHQCFDYVNYIELNSRKPSWRCPNCNQPESFIDLRIDRRMVKILSKAGEDCADVIIFADGSWKLVEDSIGNTNELSHDAIPVHRDDKICHEVTGVLPANNNVVDMTNESDGDIDAVNGSLIWNYEAIETKPCKDALDFPLCNSQQVASCTSVITHTARNQVEADVCSTSGLSFPASSRSLVSTALPDSTVLGTLESLVPGTVLNPAIADTISSAYNQGRDTNHDVQQYFGDMSEDSQVNMQIQWSQSGFNGTERQPVRLNLPLAPQNLSAQVQLSDSIQRMQPNLRRSSILASNTTSSHSTSVIGLLDRLDAAGNSFGVQHHARTSEVVSPSSQLLSLTQVQNQPVQWNIQNLGSQLAASDLHQNSRNPFEQQTGLSSCRALSQSSAEVQNTQMQTLHSSYHQMINQPRDLYDQSHLPSTTVQQNVSTMGLTSLLNQQNHWNSHHALQRPNQKLGNVRPTLSVTADGFRQTSNDHFPSTALAALGMPGPIDVLESPSEQNCRSTKRMRGSLTGEAFLAALNRYRAQPTQTAPTRPPVSSNIPRTYNQLLVSNNSNPQNSLSQQAYRNYDTLVNQPGK